MNLHRAGTIPDWQLRPAVERNWWQRIAAQTRGVVTPGNLISGGGGFVTVYSLLLISHHQLLLGVILFCVGRLADVADGFVADVTQTKSPLGRALDASIDKLLAGIALITLAVLGILPWWLGLLIGLQSLVNTSIALYAASQGVLLQPSALGKLSSFGYWLGLAVFVALPLASGTATLAITITAYAISGLALLIGVQATASYADHALNPDRPISEKVAFERYIVLNNPISSDAHNADAKVDYLRHLFPDKEVVVLTSSRGKSSEQLLRDNADKLGPKTLLCILAGDGTVHRLLNVLLHDPKLSPRVRRTPVLPLWGGNANDLAHMLNGTWSRAKLRRALTKGRVVRARPLECTLTDVHGRQTIYTAACYASFGATAYASQELEQAIPRRSALRRYVLSRVGQEIVASSRALIKAPTFTVTEHGRTRIIYERMYVNGSRFAKFIGLPLRLTDPKFHRGTIEHKHVVTMLLHLLGLLNTREVSRRSIRHDEFTVHDAVWAQFDGEPLQITCGTTVRIKSSPKPFYALSLRLR